MEDYGKFENTRKTTLCEIVSNQYIDSLREIRNFIDVFGRKELIGQYNIDKFKELFKNLEDKNYDILRKY